MTIRILTGDVRERLAELPDGSVQCCVTSPPYFGLRDYGTASWDGGDAACDHSYYRGGNGEASAKQATSNGTQKYNYRDQCRKCGARRIDQQIGLESTLAEYVATLVAVFREVGRVLRDDGTVWLNMGDSYWTDSPVRRTSAEAFSETWDVTQTASRGGNRRTAAKTGTFKNKDLMMVPARVAIALQDDGWWLRSDIIWAKKNCMPESVTDRPTSSHEHIFLLTKSAKYFYDAEAVREAYAPATFERINQATFNQQQGGSKDNQNGNRSPRRALVNLKGRMQPEQSEHRPDAHNPAGRNQRNVWHLATEPFPEAHFATFPSEIPRRCIKAGSRVGDTVLDPFLGSGTTLLVADQLGRHGVGIELNPEYARMAERRIRSDAPMFAQVAAD